MCTGHLVIPLGAVWPGLRHSGVPRQRGAHGGADHRPPRLPRVGAAAGQAARHGLFPPTGRPETQKSHLLKHYPTYLLYT